MINNLLMSFIINYFQSNQLCTIENDKRLGYQCFLILKFISINCPWPNSSDLPRVAEENSIILPQLHNKHTEILVVNIFCITLYSITNVGHHQCTFCVRSVSYRTLSKTNTRICCKLSLDTLTHKLSVPDVWLQTWLHNGNWLIVVHTVFWCTSVFNPLWPKDDI